MNDKLANLTSSITDGEHGSLKGCYSSNGYKVASMENIYNCELHLDESLPRIPFDIFQRIQKKSKVRNKSVLISAVGDVGRVAIVRTKKIDFCFISGVVIINTDDSKLIPEYLYYYLQTDIAQKKIKYGGSVNSIQKHFVLKDANEFCIDYPDIKTQQSIVNKLEPIEHKIITNNQIINVLINKIKDIYSFYFENSKLSNCDKNYFDSFSGCYLPLDWKYENLGKYIDGITTGLNPRTNFVLNNGGKIPYVTIKNIEDNGINLKKCDYIDLDAYNKIQNRSKLKNGDILYTSLSPAGLTYFLLSWENEFQINESVFCIKTNDCKLNKYYLYTALNTNSFKKYENNFVNGSNQKSIKQAQILDLKILIPSKELIDKFSNKVQSLYLEIDKLQRQNTILSSYKHEILNFLVKKLV